MAEGITQSAIIVLSFATDNIDKIDLRYSVKHCSKEASLNVSILAAAPCIHRWLSGSGLEEPGFVSPIKWPSPPAATPSSSQ